MADEEQVPPPGGPERRRHPRFEVKDRLTVRILTSTASPIRLVNFSAGDLSITSPEPFLPGEVHRIEIRSGQAQVPVVKAQVIYWRPAPTRRPDAQYLIGFTFVGLGDAQRDFLARLIDKLTKPDAS